MLARYRDVIGCDAEPASARIIVLVPARDVILNGARSPSTVVPRPDREDIPFDAPFSPVLEPDYGCLDSEDAA